MYLLGFEVCRNEEVVFFSEDEGGIVVEVQNFFITLHKVLFDSSKLFFFIENNRVMVLMICIPRSQFQFPVHSSCFLKIKSINLLMQKIQNCIVLFDVDF